MQKEETKAKSQDDIKVASTADSASSADSEKKAGSDSKKDSKEGQDVESIIEQICSAEGFLALLPDEWKGAKKLQAALEKIAEADKKRIVKTILFLWQNLPTTLKKADVFDVVLAPLRATPQTLIAPIAFYGQFFVRIAGFAGFVLGGAVLVGTAFLLTPVALRITAVSSAVVFELEDGLSLDQCTPYFTSGNFSCAKGFSVPSSESSDMNSFGRKTENLATLGHFPKIINSGRTSLHFDSRRWTATGCCGVISCRIVKKKKLPTEKDRYLVCVINNSFNRKLFKLGCGIGITDYHANLEGIWGHSAARNLYKAVEENISFSDGQCGFSGVSFSQDSGLGTVQRDGFEAKFFMTSLRESTVVFTLRADAAPDNEDNKKGKPHGSSTELESVKTETGAESKSKEPKESKGPKKDKDEVPEVKEDSKTEPSKSPRDKGTSYLREYARLRRDVGAEVLAWRGSTLANGSLTFVHAEKESFPWIPGCQRRMRAQCKTADGEKWDLADHNGVIILPVKAKQIKVWFEVVGGWKVLKIERTKQGQPWVNGDDVFEFKDGNSLNAYFSLSGTASLCYVKEAWNFGSETLENWEWCGNECQKNHFRNSAGPVAKAFRRLIDRQKGLDHIADFTYKPSISYRTPPRSVSSSV